MLSVIALTTFMTSCSDDDENENPIIDPVVTHTNNAWVLNEGAYEKNNAGITRFLFDTNEVTNNDLYFDVNQKYLGDTAQDIIVGSDGYIYVSVYGSGYIAKLDHNGVEQGRLSFTEGALTELGQPRYLVEKNGALYATCYGGYVVKINTDNMSILETVKTDKLDTAVDNNPEYIIEKDGYIYCTNSGWGEGNTVSVINASNFAAGSRTLNVMMNPDHILAARGHVFVQGYGAYYDYPWGELNLTTGEFKQLGNASNWAELNGVLYLVNSVTDWATYQTTNYFSSYDISTGTLTEGSYLVDAPEELASASIYGMNFNTFNNYLYIMTSDFVTNGKIYVFDDQLKYVTTISSGGVGPRKVVFFQ